MIALEARGLLKCYTAVPAVSDVSFSLSSGEVLGCLGPNGSGKSTTVRMLTGLLGPTRGQVLSGGKNIQTDLVGYRERLGYVPEEADLYPFLSGWEYLELVGTLRGLAAQRSARKSMPCSSCSRSTPIAIPRSVRTPRECANASS